MPRKPRVESPTGAYHFINRGVNKKKIFHRPEDFSFYKDLLKEYTARFDIAVYHYCLMANHTHLLLRSPDIKALSGLAHFTQRRYAYYYCKTYHWSEQVFRKRFVSIPVNRDAYLMECGRYIELNPVKAGLVKDPLDYEYSSYRYYAQGSCDDLITESPAYQAMGENQCNRQTTYSYYIKQPRLSEMTLEVTV